MVTVREQRVASTKNISLNPNSRRTITVHETDNTGRGANAAAHANLQSRPNPRVASWHWQVDDHEAVRSFPHTVRTFHAGTALGNRESISVEICVNAGIDQAQAYRNAAELVARIMREEGIPIERVVQHNAYSGKNCPSGLRSGGRGTTWPQFVAMVQAALNGDTTLPSPPAEVKPTPEVSPSKPTSRALYPELRVDGDDGARTWSAFQLLMRSIGLYEGRIDGDPQHLTITAAERWMKKLGYYAGIIEADHGKRAVFGPVLKRAIQSFLYDKGLYRNGNHPKSVMVDARWEERSVMGFQRYLNEQRRYLA